MTQIPQERVLVYDRVDANRRNTLVLLGVFAVVFLPVAAYITAYMMLWVAIFLGIALTVAGAGDVLSENAGFYLGLTAPVAVAIVCLVVFLQYRCAAWAVLRLSGARPLAAGEEPEFEKTVENVCIGAGLPRPRLYLMDSGGANAFATGMSPAGASLAVTKGLLQLLDRRELEGVLAHELAQVGNEDIRLGTLLAAGVGLLRLPFVILAGIIRFLFRVHWIVGAGAVLYMGLPLAATIPFGISVGFDLLDEDPVEGALFLSTMVLPFYLFLAAPLIGQLVRAAVLRRREFLADADAALLTRYPEGLARALAKMESAGNRGIKAGAAAAHLYVVDPLAEDAPWWDRTLSSHPPIDQRIALLAQMGSGIPASVLESAQAAGKQFQTVVPAVPADPASGAGEGSGFSPDTPSGAAYRLAAPRTPVYEKPDTGTARLAELPGGSLIAVWAVVGDFFRVILRDDKFGYISRGTAMTPVEPAGVPEE